MTADFASARHFSRGARTRFDGSYRFTGWGHHGGSSGFWPFHGFFWRSHSRTHYPHTYRTDARTEPPAEGDFGEEEEERPENSWLCCVVPAGLAGGVWLLLATRRFIVPKR